MDSTIRLALFGLSTKLARLLHENLEDNEFTQKIVPLLKKLAVATAPMKEQVVTETNKVQRETPAGAFGRRPRTVEAFGHKFAEDSIARMVCSMFCYLEQKGLNIDHKQISVAIIKAYPENTYNEVRAAIDEKKWANLQFNFQQRGEYAPQSSTSVVVKPVVKGKKPELSDDMIEELGL